MLGKLNIASYGLAVGAFGQSWFYRHLLPHVPVWLVLGVLFLPWIAVFSLTFCKRAPFGPRPFRLSLTFVMGWYALVTILAEILHYLHPAPPDAGPFPITVARILMYFALSSFVAIARACILSRRCELGRGTAGGAV